MDRLSKNTLEQSLGAITSAGPAYDAPEQDQPDPARVEEDAMLQALRRLGRVIGEIRKSTMGWGFDVLCPWDHDHSNRTDSGAFYVPLRERFQCQHGHCNDRTTGDARARIDELLREDSGGLECLATLEFDAISSLSRVKAALKPLGSYEATEDGLALAFAGRHQDRLRFDHTRGAWFRWTGGFWRQDETQYAFDWSRDLAREFRSALQDLTSAQVRAWGKMSVPQAIEKAARADRRLAVDGLSWDRDPWRAGVPGGEVDLITGELQPSDPAHGITRQLLVAPAAMATPIWDQFLWESTGGDPEMIVFLQAWSGYCLTGDISEEKFVFFYGPGGNGKGTYLYTIDAILNDYAARTAADMFMVRKYEAHSEEIARLAGVRMITASEIEEGRTFNAGRLKDFTGRDGKLTGRFMRENTFAFMPRFKVNIVGNNQPRLRAVDKAMERRLVLIPFTQTPAIADTMLKDRLVSEYPGILAWMIEGEKLRRAAGGLAGLVPAVATAATKRYLDEQDTLRTWATECGVFGQQQVGVTAALENYRDWCQRQGQQCVLTINDFALKFTEMFPECEKVRRKKEMIIEGVSFTQPSST